MMQMDDATLLKMTKTRLSILQMPESTLQKLALKCICRNYEFYAQNQIKEHNPENLPKPLRNQVLEELSNHLINGAEPCYTPGEMNLRVAMLKQLVNSQTLKVDLTGFMYCHYHRVNPEEFMTKLLAVLADNAPNLEELIIEVCGRRKWAYRWYPLKVFETKEMANSLTQLHKLKSLIMPKIQFDKIQHLGHVCRHLPNLQVLWACVRFIRDEEMLNYQYLESCFPSLIVHFIAHRPRFKDLEFLLDEHCSRNAEKLDMVYKSESRMFYFGLLNANISGRTFYTGTPGHFRRVSIEMDHDKGDGKKYNRYYEDDWEHPTDHLVPVDELTESQDASRFNSIRFVDGGSSFRRVIQIYQPFCWPNVHTFTMEDLHARRYLAEDLKLSLIAERCPNLERLIMKHVHIMGDPALNVMILSSLTELDLDLLKPPERRPRQHEEPQLFLPSHILSIAPNLERVRLKATVEFFTVEDLKVVTSMIVEGTFLRKLQKLHIVIRDGSMDEDGYTRAEETPEENLEQAIKLLKTASAFLPSLTEIKLTTKDISGVNNIISKRLKSRKDGNRKNESAGIFERLHYYDFLDAYPS